MERERACPVAQENAPKPVKMPQEQSEEDIKREQ